MKAQRAVGMMVGIIGVVLLFVSAHIKKEVEEGTLKVKSAEKIAGQANSLFSVSPVTQQLSQAAMKNADKKIKAGKEQIAYYSKLADQLQMGGWVLIAAGILIIWLGGRHLPKKK